MHSPEQEGKTEPKMIFPELLTLHLVNSVSQFHFMNLLLRFHVFDPAPLPLGLALEPLRPPGLRASPLSNYHQVKLRNRKSRLSKNQFDLTVSKSERFLQRLLNSVSQFHFLNGTPSFTLFRVRPFSSYLMDTSPYISGHFRGN